MHIDTYLKALYVFILIFMANIGVIMDLQPLSGIEYIILVEILFQQVLVLLICLFMASHGHSLRRRCRNRREVRYHMSV